MLTNSLSLLESQAALLETAVIAVGSLRLALHFCEAWELFGALGRKKALY